MEEINKSKLEENVLEEGKSKSLHFCWSPKHAGIISSAKIEECAGCKHYKFYPDLIYSIKNVDDTLPCGLKDYKN